jgi:hypothetical protein
MIRLLFGDEAKLRAVLRQKDLEIACLKLDLAATSETMKADERND